MGFYEIGAQLVSVSTGAPRYTATYVVVLPL